MKNKKGMTLFIAVVIMGILLFISFAVMNITLKGALFASSGRDSQFAFYAADAGLECALYWDSKFDISKFDPSVSGSPINCAGVSIFDGQPIPGGAVTQIGGGGGSVSDTVWVEDGLPAGATSQQDPFNWLGSNPSPISGSLANQSVNTAGNHQQYFTGATTPFVINSGDNMLAYVYLDSTNPPTEVMLQWNNGNWEHRAYWGANSINWGTDGTVSRRYMGALPTPLGQWVRLTVPASLVGLEGSSLNGIAFTLFDGKATWDKVGKSVSSGGSGNPTSTFGFNMQSVPYCAIVTVTKNGNTTTIKSKGYNTCDTSNPRRVERGIEVRY